MISLLSIRRILFGALAGIYAVCAHAQVVTDIYYLDPNIPDFFPYKDIPLLLGDGFTAEGGSISVKLIGNDADDRGDLYFVNPLTGNESLLFSNKDTNHPTKVLGTFPKGTPIVFKYRTDVAEANTYTGSNQPGFYNFDSDPALKGLAINHQPLPVSDFAVRNNDKRWAVAGRYNTTTVVFGFEDQQTSRPDFNDIVFLMTGVGLDTEVKLKPPVISGTTPFKDKTTVTIALPSNATGGEKIFYTTNGSTPTFSDQGLPTGATLQYAGPFDVTANTTVMAVTWKANETGAKYTASDAATAVFTKLGALDAPVSSPAGGVTSWSEGLAITLTQAQDGEIHYVLCDPAAASCADPTQASPQYVKGKPVVLTRPTIIKAIAYKTGSVESPILAAPYLLSLQVVSAVYLDENGDGRIDAARIVLGSKTSEAPDKLTLDNPIGGGPGVTLTKAQMTVDPANPTVVWARFPDQQFPFGTSFPEKQYGHIPAGSDVYPAQDFIVGDSVGPVVVSAQATPPTATEPATLKVVYSEDVQIDVNSKDFPFNIKRSVGVDPNGQVKVDKVVKQGNNTYEYVMVAGADRYPIDGDSLKLLSNGAVKDTHGVSSNMKTYVGVKGAPSSLQVVITIKLDTAVSGSPIPDPRIVAIPISVYSDAATQVSTCLDCRTTEWSKSDPQRPASFPTGPKITIKTRGAFSFDLAFFDHFGHFVNRAKGTVSEAMLAGLPVDAQGNNLVTLMWYPVSDKGAHVATGVYIARGTFTTLAGTSKGPQGETVNLSGMKTPITARLGYLRRP
ncbi:MAG: FN3 associated domain-containing protein [Fibrobacteria bacterium]